MVFACTTRGRFIFEVKDGRIPDGRLGNGVSDNRRRTAFFASPPKTPQRVSSVKYHEYLTPNTTFLEETAKGGC